MEIFSQHSLPLLVRPLFPADLCSCGSASLTTGQAPSLVFPSADGGPPISLCDWYTDLRYCPEPNAPKDASSEDWESVESIVGIPRRLFEVVYRVSTLYSISRPVGWSQAGSNAHCAPIDHIWVAEATKLLVELNGWDYQARFEDPDEPPLKTRLDFGTKIYVRALEVRSTPSLWLDKSRLTAHSALDSNS